MGRPSDRDPAYMHQEHGTTKLITDYGVLNQTQLTGLGELTLKTEIGPEVVASLLRNQNDYDDWEYGTEPIPHDPTWTRKPNS